MILVRQFTRPEPSCKRPDGYCSRQSRQQVPNNKLSLGIDDKGRPVRQMRQPTGDRCSRWMDPFLCASSVGRRGGTGPGRVESIHAPGIIAGWGCTAPDAHFFQGELQAGLLRLYPYSVVLCGGSGIEWFLSLTIHSHAAELRDLPRGIGL